MSRIISINNEMLPDFSLQGYVIEQELGNNLTGGRVTYRAINQKEQKPVVIKQFQFAQTSSSWFDYEALKREIELLQQLHHPQIPKYLDSFQTDKGFCLVQEHKNATPLAVSRNFTISEIQQIAQSILKILIYLQHQKPTIIHRDIKPENILVDEKLNVYLVDFGLAKIGVENVGYSMVKGSLGFMSPEQMFNRNLSTASDLYSLGVTLICLLLKIPSEKVGELIDENYRINLKSLLPNLDCIFRLWLEKMVEPNPCNRFPDAVSALRCLKPVIKKSVATAKSDKPKIQKSPTPSKIIPLVAASICLGLILMTINYSLNYSSRNRYQPVVNPKDTDTDLDSEIIKKLKINKQCINCDLTGFDLRGLDLRSVDLKNSNLRYADLREADLRGAYLRGADLRGAKLNGANLASTDLYGATLDKEF
ncbi:MAG: serine/threonine-protein kinase [Cyanobacteria bacterium P01_A01_bin.45]